MGDPSHVCHAFMHRPNLVFLVVRCTCRLPPIGSGWCLGGAALPSSFDDPHSGNFPSPEVFLQLQLQLSSAQLSLSAPLTAYAHSHSCKSTVPYLLKVSTIEICMPCSGRQALLGPRYRHDMLCCNCTALHFCFSAHGRQVHGIPSFLLPRFFLSSSFFRT